ncbi:MAG TPA: 4'-phosphopantetheinyl transferase superfamily protein [Candidatus Dormibacteraeota bacterium]
MVEIAVSSEAQVQVWSAPIDLSPAAQGRLSAVLSPSERERAGRLHSERDRARFSACRGWLREVLAEHLETEPGKVEFLYRAGGKPALAPTMGCDLRFNVAQSGGLALIALAEKVEVGVDLELVRPDFRVDLIADRFFSQAERARLRGLVGAARVGAFFEMWTQKEAYLKGVGIGLSDQGLRVDTVSPNGPRLPAATQKGLGASATSGWTVRSIYAGGAYAAALAVQAPDLPLPAVAQPLWPRGA